MKIVLDLIGILIQFIALFYFYKLVNSLVVVKQKKIIKIIVVFGLLWVVNVVVFSGDIVNVSYALLGFLLILLFGYEGTYLKKISAVFIFYPMVISINYLRDNPPIQMLRGSVLENPWEAKAVFVGLTGVIAFAWFLLYRVFGYKIKTTANELDTKSWLLIDCICMAPFIAMISGIIMVPMGNEERVYPTAIACLITGCGVLLLISDIIKNLKVRMEITTLKLEHTYYKELEENQLDIRKLHHDMKNHLSVIVSLAEDGEKEKLKKYYENLQERFLVSNRIFCKNSIVNAIINVKYNRIMQEGIDSFFHVDIDGILSVEDVDICSLFANTLDNAIEASLRIENISFRKISVKARKEKGYFMYEIKNRKKNEIVVKDGKYLSDKEKKKEHGFGVENIKNIVDKYNGNIDISYTKEEFCVLILIKL